MEQEHAGHRLKSAVVKGHPLGIALHELHQRTSCVVQPFVGLSEIGLREINPHKRGLGHSCSDLMQGAASAGGNVENPQAALAPF